MWFAELVLDIDRPNDQSYESTHRLQRMRRGQTTKNRDQQYIRCRVLINYSDDGLSDDSSLLYMSSGAKDIASALFNI